MIGRHEGYLSLASLPQETLGADVLTVLDRMLVHHFLFIYVMNMRENSLNCHGKVMELYYHISVGPWVGLPSHQCWYSSANGYTEANWGKLNCLSCKSEPCPV